MKNVTMNLILLAAMGVTFSACAESKKQRPPAHLTGVYETKMSDGSTDILVLNDDGTMGLSLTRQVGGPGGISKEGVVPYPTVCRVKQHGLIVEETADSLSYKVTFVQLILDEDNSEACGDYVKAFNNLIRSESVEFSIEKPRELTGN